MPCRVRDAHPTLADSPCSNRLTIFHITTHCGASAAPSRCRFDYLSVAVFWLNHTFIND